MLPTQQISSRLAACARVNTTVDDCWLIRLKALLKGSQARISGKRQAFQAADAFQMCHKHPVQIPEMDLDLRS